MKEHDLKTWPEYFSAVDRGMKNFEIRLDDRGFEVGDILLLREYFPGSESCTGRELRRKITYVFPGGSFGVMPGYVVLGLERIEADSNG